MTSCRRPFRLRQLRLKRQCLASRGQVGLGTYNTQAEFRNAKVTQDGTTLLENSLSTVPANPVAGDWSVQNGVLVQSGNGQPAVVDFRRSNWADFTYSVQARKTGGREGFIIPFHYKQRPKSHLVEHWRLGQHAQRLSKDGVDGSMTEFGSSSVTVETGRWYDIRIETKGRQIRAYLDKKLIADVQEPTSSQVDPIYAHASRDAANGDIILKVVNAGDTFQPVQFDLQGVNRISATATGEMMTGQPNDVNTIDQPMKIAPQKLKLTQAGKAFGYQVPANSVMVLRLKTR